MARNANRLHQNSLNVHQRIALFSGNVLGSPWTIYIFTLLALISLPAVVESKNLVLIIGWITQTFIQLVALAILQSKAEIDGKHAEIVANETHTSAQKAEEDAEEIKTMLLQAHEHLFDLKKMVDNSTKSKKK